MGFGVEARSERQRGKSNKRGGHQRREEPYGCRGEKRGSCDVAAWEGRASVKAETDQLTQRVEDLADVQTPLQSELREEFDDAREANPERDDPRPARASPRQHECHDGRRCKRRDSPR
jgi:hypothetical protein